MEKNNAFKERRLHQRADMKNIVLGILNADEPVTIGVISDISLGGAKYTHELDIGSHTKPIGTIDLIADNSILMIDIPCEFAWNHDSPKGASPGGSSVRQCGLQFGRLNEKQLFLLRKLIKRCASPGAAVPTLEADD